MDNARCPSPQKLVKFYDQKIRGKAFSEINEHVKSCKQCSKNVQIINKIEKILSMQDKITPQPEADSGEIKNHLSLELLYDYLTANVTEAEKLSIQGHLNACSRCFNEMTTLVRNSQPIPTEDEAELLAMLDSNSPKSQLAQILALSTLAYPPRAKPAPKFSLFKKFYRMLKAFFSPFIRLEAPILKGAYAFAALAILVILGRTPFFYLQSLVLTHRGVSQLTENYYIDSRAEPRPSGGFEYSELTTTRGPITFKNFNAVQKNFEKAMKAKNLARTQQYLATYYLLIKKDFVLARQYYMNALAQDSTNAKIQNDLGTLFWHNQDYVQALQKFQSALSYDPDYPEAQYNLALVFEQMRKLPEARIAWQNYLHLDENSDWSKIARDHLNRIRTSSE